MQGLSITKTTETGAFIRTTIKDKNGKKHQTTQKFKPNDEKVILGMIGEFEVYAYPYRFPDKIFIGRFPTNTTIDLISSRCILSAYNKIRWFLKGDWQNKPKTTIRTQMRRQHIVSAYNNGLNHQQAKENGSFLPNLIKENTPEQVFKCPFCFSEIWFNTQQALVKHIEYEKSKKEESHSQKLTRVLIIQSKVWVIKQNGKWRILK